MAAPAAAAISKVATTLLTDERSRKAVGWVVAAVLSPLIILLVLLMVFLQGGSKHNTDTVYLSFYGGEIPSYTPAEFNDYILEMRGCFEVLDGEIAKVNEEMEGNKLDAVQVKSVFFSLCFGRESPARRDLKQFVECFVAREEADDGEDDVDGTASVLVPISSLNAVYANIARRLGVQVTAEQKANAQEIYRIIAGRPSGGDRGYDPDLPFVGIDGFTSPIGPDWRPYVTSEFGWRVDPLTYEQDFHRGLDMCTYEGAPIYAALDGVVIGVGTDPHSSYGYHVTIDHGGGFVTLYAHNSRVLVSLGDKVKAGQQIAQMGATGRVTGVHLHLEVQINGELQNPRQYLPG